ncbi:Tyrosine--tRNA ligase cytoplasmic [Taenia solium]|eukprot:TsM_000410900 transcript=TsM_000410900 gene=TsM_000410900
MYLLARPANREEKEEICDNDLCFYQVVVTLLTSRRDKKHFSRDAKQKPSHKSGEKEEDLRIDVSRIEMRVDKIVEVERHPDADPLFVEKPYTNRRSQCWLTATPVGLRNSVILRIGRTLDVPILFYICNYLTCVVAASIGRHGAINKHVAQICAYKKNKDHGGSEKGLPSSCFLSFCLEL